MEIFARITGHQPPAIAARTQRQAPVHMRPRRGGAPSHNPAKALVYLMRANLALGLALIRVSPAELRRRGHAVITYVVPLVGALICLTTIGELLRRRQLREKYAVRLVGTALVVLILFPGLLERLSRTFGVLVPSNLLFFGAIVLLLSVSVHQSWELSRLEDETRKLAEDLAILRLESEQSRRRGDEAR